MKIAKFISVYTIIKQLYRDFGINDISESDAIEWCADAVEHLMIKEIYTVNTAFLQVKNYHCEMPDNLIRVLQIAKHTHKKKLPKFPQNIIMEVMNDKCGCNTKQVDCGCGKKTVDNAHLKFCSSFLINYGVAFNISHMNMNIPEWIEVEPSGNNFFNAGVCNGGECSNAIQYKLDNGKILFSFKEAIIALSYITHQLDEDGFPMIPDEVSAREAVTKYLIMKIMQRYWYMGREGYQDKMIKAEQDWHWYCKQFKNKCAMPDEDEYRKIERQELRLFPIFTPDFNGSINICDDICGCSIFNDNIPCGCQNSDYPLVFAPYSEFPMEGNSNKLYIDTIANVLYRWQNRTYIPIESDITLARIQSLIDEIDGGGE